MLRYYIRHRNGQSYFSYSGDLEEALKKAEKDLQKVCDDSDFDNWSWLYALAKKKVDAHFLKISDLERFIASAKRALSKGEKE